MAEFRIDATNVEIDVRFVEAGRAALDVGSKEVDYVMRKGDRLVAMEVKSADADSVSGMKEFKARYVCAKPYLIGGQGMPPDMFFSCRVENLLG